MRNQIFLLTTALIVMACGQALADTTAPTISSVVVTPAVVASWDTVHVAVTVTDDTGVANVTVIARDAWVRRSKPPCMQADSASILQRTSAPTPPSEP